MILSPLVIIYFSVVNMSAKSQLTTDWICIATAGETVDQRQIPEQWLVDMAETYDPSLYTALLWPEHRRFYGNVGEVQELKHETQDGITKLYARLCPTDDLIYSNRRNQLLFSSIEPTPDGNFRGTGRCYLEGLGVTDEPASVGTDRMRFNADKNAPVYGAPVPLVFNLVTEKTGDPKMSTDKKPSWRSLFNIQEPEKPEATKITGEDSEKLSAMALGLSELEDKFSALEKKYSSLNELTQTIDEIKKQTKEFGELVNSDKFKKLAEELPTVLDKFSKLDAVITKLPDGAPGKTTETKDYVIV